ncbi:hypothetical protein SYNPS1DRAFT_28519 [Syncephalis pseudoplumigaleata]|uniref:Uncharacterized protein n=1 Tax=Syncephalis pseudoplumigaleata TaxID=1712513 RepID=A0A4P9Z0E8_9FUNG|nr:hypothetical protein SYNPS1DRAFT_28519 [Syncephalis pseudoplumigaleata]|eukprot:RKP25758.1 hypothetical protein SYNPS1DRAFT_28519 [Syncephalis pseudoplumigaleata]
MHFLAKSILPLMAVLATASAQSTSATPPAAGKPATPSGPANLSDGCLKVLDSPDVMPGCISDVEADFTGGSAKSLTAVCDTPADNARGHRCSDDQVKKAISTLEASCKSELSSNQTAVQNVYSMWMMYGPSMAGRCTKDGNGKYCMDTTGAAAATGAQCEGCSRTLLENALKQKPVGDPALGGESFQRQMGALKSAAAKCNINTSGSGSGSSSSSSSPTVGGSYSTTMLMSAVGTVVVGALMLTA